MNGQFSKDVETFMKVFNHMKEMERQNDKLENANVEKGVEVILNRQKLFLNRQDHFKL